MLTKKILEEMPAGTIFARGWASDDEWGINMTRSHKCLRWIAKRGDGAPDWAIYCHFAENDDTYVEQCGDKVHRESHIRKLVECDDEALKWYRQ